MEFGGVALAPVDGLADDTASTGDHPRLGRLIHEASVRGREGPTVLGLVFPCDGLALRAAAAIENGAIARPVLIGPRAAILAAADTAGIDCSSLELIDSGPVARDAALLAVKLVRDNALNALMKGSLHTDELMSAVVERHSGLRTDTRISHAFVFDLPRYHKLLMVADCVVNIAPDLKTKAAILGNAVRLAHCLGLMSPRVAILAAVEILNHAIQATVDARALVELAKAGAWAGAIVDGPLGFDNAISAKAARIKGITSEVAGEPDLMVVPDLNSGNMLYKSFVYIGGGDCAGVVLGARVPIVLTSRADSELSRIASVALAALAAQPAS